MKIIKKYIVEVELEYWEADNLSHLLKSTESHLKTKHEYSDAIIRNVEEIRECLYNDEGNVVVKLHS